MLDKILYQVKNCKTWVRALVLGTTTKVPGGTMMMEGSLGAILIKADGKHKDLGVICRRVVTTVGVNLLRDDLNAASGGADVSQINFHDSGTGATAEAIGDTNLVTPAGPTTRATGTQSGAVSKIYVSVGTITYAGTLAITEHGIFSNATRGSGVLWDRSVFSAINVVSGDSIQFTYSLTISDGG